MRNLHTIRTTLHGVTGEGADAVIFIDYPCRTARHEVRPENRRMATVHHECAERIFRNAGISIYNDPVYYCTCTTCSGEMNIHYYIKRPGHATTELTRLNCPRCIRGDHPRRGE